MAVLAASGVALSSVASAAVPPPTTRPVNWVGAAATPLPYATAANWDTGLVPTNADNDFARIDNAGIATIGSGDSVEAAFLNLGTTFGQSGELRIDGGLLTVGEMRVGGRETLATDHADWGNTTVLNDGGTGAIVQTGGTVSVTYTHGQNPDLTNFQPPIQSLYIGDSGLAADNHAIGSYAISGAASVLTVGIANNDAIVVGTGAGTQGTFVQQGGAVTSSGSLTVARGGATASYTMSDGTLNVGSGARASAQNLRLGDGEYPGGTFAPTTSGSFTHSGGTVTVQNDTTIGRNTGTGAYTINGSSAVLDIQNNLNIGHGGTGSVVQGEVGQPGPTVKAGSGATGSRGISVGISGNATLPGVGTYTLRSGTIDIGNDEAADYLAVGDGSNGTGTFNMEGGTIDIGDLLQLGRNNSAFDTNRFNMNGGTITTGRVVIGGGNGASGGKGTFTMTGGALTSSASNNVGFSGSSSGTLDIQGGTYTLTGEGNNGIMAIGNSTSGGGTLLVSGGTLSVEGTGSVIDIGRNNASGSLTLSGTGEIKAELLRANNRTGSAVRTIVFDGPASKSTIATLSLDDVTMSINGGTHAITTANVNADAALNINASSAFTNLNVTDGVVTLGPAGTTVLRANTMTIPSGKIDLKDNKLVTGDALGGWNGVDAYTGVSGLVQSGRGSAGGNAQWNGASGITTSDTRAIDSSNRTSLGVIDASDKFRQPGGAPIGEADTALFGGQTVTGADTLVMFTWGGDANLDGKINIDDYGRIDSNVGTPGANGWANGDFNYDGKINIDDYGIIDSNISHQGGVVFPTGGGAGGVAASAAGVSAVPEPAGVALLALGVTGLLARRGRRAREGR